jgi:hypothetical protein
LAIGSMECYLYLYMKKYNVFTGLSILVHSTFYNTTELKWAK